MTDDAIEQLLPWCRRVARKAWRNIPQSTGYELEEMVAVAALALVESAHTWDNGKKDTYALPFKAYACWRMKVAIYDGLRRGLFGGMRPLRYKGEIKQAFTSVYLDDPDESMRIKVFDRFDRAVERRDSASKALAQCEPRGARILWRTFGQGLRVEDAAREMGISQARASQLRAAALKATRAPRVDPVVDSGRD